MNILKKVNYNYNMARIYIKKKLTHNLGKVVEDDKKITCYIKSSNLEKRIVKKCCENKNNMIKLYYRR